ncbi:hypothetical protein [Rhodococcus daqingensis]|uniref:Aspartyl-phosphate phosphatase Spo0E family protein n=1 Tax=Rhodococcus daqingensis TaxID=2479363 RepID=A0ABW2S306_9NOCA
MMADLDELELLRGQCAERRRACDFPAVIALTRQIDIVIRRIAEERTRARRNRTGADHDRTRMDALAARRHRTV